MAAAGQVLIGARLYLFCMPWVLCERIRKISAVATEASRRLSSISDKKIF